MQTCPRCGQADVDGTHQCAASSAAEHGSGVRGAVVALVLLVLSLGVFAAALTFTVLHQQTPAAPVVIQTTLPASDATDTAATPVQATPDDSGSATATPKVHGSGGGNGTSRQPTPTPIALPTATPLPSPTVVLPTLTPTDTPQPTPTRSPQ